MAARKVGRGVLYEAKSVVIDCCQNESVDVRCGGPSFVGYDFLVAAGVPDKEIDAFIRKALEKHDRPCEHVVISRSRQEVLKKNLWTRRRIEKEIKNNDVTKGTPWGRSPHRPKLSFKPTDTLKYVITWMTDNKAEALDKIELASGHIDEVKDCIEVCLIIPFRWKPGHDPMPYLRKR